MAFTWYQNTGRTTPVIISHIKAKASQAFKHGQALVVASGRWQPAAKGAKVGGIYAGDPFTSGANDLIDVIEVTANDAFIVDYTGTPDSGFVEGVETADIGDDADALNAADITGGAFAVLKIDTTNKKAYVRGKLRQFS